MARVVRVRHPRADESRGKDMPVDTARVGTERQTVSVIPWTLPLAFAGGALIAAGRLVGGPLVLPVLSLMLVAAGFLVAASLFLFRRHIRRASAEPAWLLAGALVLLGFAASLLSDSDGALVALDGMHAASTVAASQ
jgi:hypothetical protein